MEQNELIPTGILEKLPNLLKDGCSVWKSERERDVFLISALAVLSGCQYNVKGIYDSRECGPNLYTFIVAPAASGKGALVYAKKLGEYLHEIISKGKQEEFLNECISEEGQPLTTAEEHKAIFPMKRLFLPANASAAAVIKHLHECDGRGIICETEADTMFNALKQDWGSYDDMLRKAFHHEPIAYMRKEEYREIKSPKLSLALSGTPEQVKRLIPSAENGLFSRIVFYSYSEVPNWRDVRPCTDCTNLDEHFDMLGKEVSKMAFYLSYNPTQVELKDEHWDRLNKFYADALMTNTAILGSDVASVVKRLGLTTYRVCMILTALRKYETGSKEHIMVCSDEDFDTAMELTGIFLSHSLDMYEQLPGQTSEIGCNKFLTLLPIGDFNRAEAIAIGEMHEYRERTVGKYLKKLSLDRAIEHISHGRYRKG